MTIEEFGQLKGQVDSGCKMLYYSMMEIDDGKKPDMNRVQKQLEKFKTASAAFIAGIEVLITKATAVPDPTPPQP